MLFFFFLQPFFATIVLSKKFIIRVSYAGINEIDDKA